jgi:hypothetical protein
MMSKQNAGVIGKKDRRQVLFKINGRPFIYIKNNKGPSTEPWATL